MASKFSSPFMAKSPLHGAYTSAAGQGSTYVSNRKAFQQLQDDIVTGAKGVDEALNDPEVEIKRQRKRRQRQQQRFDDLDVNIKEGVKDKKGNPVYIDKDGKVINRASRLNKRINKRTKKIADLDKQIEENKNKGVVLSDEEKAVITVMRNKNNSPANMLGKCPKGKVRSKINKKCVSKKGAGKEYDK